MQTYIIKPHILKAVQLFCMAFVLNAGLANAQDEIAVSREISEEGILSFPELSVIELFTAQSCAFCQDADDILDVLGDIQGIITFACHVDYYPSDSDPLARDYCTERQKEYLRAKGARYIYTPHFVIDGQDFAEAKRLDIESVLQKKGRFPVTRLQIEGGEGATYTVALGDMTKVISEDAPARVLLLGIHEPIASTRGKFEMKNAASQYGLLTEWDGTPKDVQFDLANAEGLERLVVVVQGSDLRILAAGEKSLKEAEGELHNPFEDMKEDQNLPKRTEHSETLPVPEGIEITE